jgi:hypothetical protein
MPWIQNVAKDSSGARMKAALANKQRDPLVSVLRVRLHLTGIEPGTLHVEARASTTCGILALQKVATTIRKLEFIDLRGRVFISRREFKF